MITAADIQPEFESLLERKAFEKIRSEAFDYIARGAGSEATMQENLLAFSKWKIRPRVLRNVAEIDMSSTLFDQKLSMPVLFAPIGVQRIAHPEGELASARAAKELNVPLVVSSAASYSMEDIANELGGCSRWFQLYCSSEEIVTRSLVQRAEANGYSAIVITVDTPVLGIRESDARNQYSPLEEGDGCGNYLNDPAFLSLLDLSPEEDMKAALQKQIDIIDQPGLDWDELKKIRELTSLPILLKGVLHPEDAKLALENNVDGIIVSNHGGRQLDHCIASLDALPDIKNIVQDRIPILLDSGIRSGVDVFKALALGADAVLLGRPLVYGLAINGEVGVMQVVHKILHELEITMALAGVRSIKEINSDLLFKG
ncbi:alpha-hydroxy-acid oxidizing protein [Sporosarcina gallistercoris]|uniref:L-lactate oxidase n=1 Tax=Sporosarcina gallistercoris TaxID=2762245 RepID=A0ABR8PGL8_9BACL|nr:alpha-hydroxy-acid oxidizing protein [Sporosarcina gallistercoris]MBD7907311.1 alpha-hydroxy-acid oxidizing protein [Sporosarcina gallistercoris]